MTSDCIHRRNPAGGFAADHSTRCYMCWEPATCHVNVDGRWCGNACGKCGKALAAKHPAADITDEVITSED